MKQPKRGSEVLQYSRIRNNSVFRASASTVAVLSSVLYAVVVLSGCAALTGSPTQSPNNSTGTAAISVSPTTIAFSNVSLGTTAKQTVAITNSSSVNENVTAVTATGSEFSISGIALPYALNAGTSTTFTAEFTPMASGNATGSISISAASTNSDPTVTIALTGTGTQAQMSLNPASVSFGTVTVGQTNSQPVIISNPGKVGLTISSYTVTGAGFSASGLSTPLTIQPGQSASLNIAFDPSSAGNASGAVSLTSNAPGSPTTVALTGTGAAATASLSVSPSNLAFGNVTINASSSQSISLKNTGNSNVTISAVNVTGAGFSDSGVNAGLVLTPSQSAALNVTFTPTTAGAASGSVTIASSAAGSPQSVALSGTGSTSHSIALTWSASSSSDVVGYNVYRGTVSGTYSKITSSPVANTSYTDARVQSGQNITYYYVVTAIDSTGAESTDSNQATATIP